MAKRTPPLLTPFAIMSIVLALGATNVAVNEVTHTSEGRARVSTVSSSSSSVESVSQSSESRPEPDRRDESSSSSAKLCRKHDAGKHGFKPGKLKFRDGKRKLKLLVFIKQQLELVFVKLVFDRQPRR